MFHHIIDAFSHFPCKSDFAFLYFDLQWKQTLVTPAVNEYFKHSSFQRSIRFDFMQIISTLEQTGGTVVFI